MTPRPNPAAPVTWALILRKPAAAAKSRLAPVLSPACRRELAEQMFRHVLATALATAGLQRIAVVSPDRPELPPTALWIQDTAGTMNGCVKQGLTEARRRGAERVVVLPADLPLLGCADLAALLNTADNCDLVIAPDHHGEGTNALLLPANTDFEPLFGADSFQRHLAQARQLDLKTCTLHNRGLGFDLDDWHDWQTYRDSIAAVDIAASS